MASEALLHQAAPHDPTTGKQSCARCGVLLLKGADPLPEGPVFEIGPIVLPYTDAVKITGTVTECVPPVQVGTDPHALPMDQHQYLATYQSAPRPWREVPPIDVWPTTLAVLIDPEAPRVCMYAQVDGGSPPCKQEGWFVYEKSEVVPMNLYGCRKHAPLMGVFQQPCKRLVRP